MVSAPAFLGGKDRPVVLTNVEAELVVSRLVLGCCMADQNVLLSSQDPVVDQVLWLSNERTGHRARESRKRPVRLRDVLIQMRLAHTRHDG